MNMDNLAELLGQYTDRTGRVLYREWRNEAWLDVCAGDVLALAARWQEGFRRAGLQAGDRVALCVKNSVNWVAIDMAALGLGLVVVPLYINDNAENIAWCVEHAEARLLVLENLRLLGSLSFAAEHDIELIILQGEAPVPTHSVDEWLPAAAMPFEIARLERGALASIVYTSGTTGRPKGVMLSHGNILSNVEAILQIVQVFETDVLLSVLPLSHMFERTCGYYTPLAAGATVVYARGIGQLAEDIASQKPTVLIAVPRVFERFLARVEQALATSLLKRLVFHMAVWLGWRVFSRRATWPERAIRRPLRRAVAQPIFARLGGRLRLTVVGGAPLEARVAQTLCGLGLNLIQGYGLTETAPVVSANREGDNDPLSVGRALSGIEVRSNDAHELLVRAPSVMLGYWRNPEATAAALDPEGWFNTGDLVDFRGGRIYIKGRSKDVLVLSSGEKLPPQEVETAILDDGLFEQVMLVGEGRPYLTLLAVSREPDEKKLLQHANARLRHFPRWVRIRRVIALTDPWTVEEGLLTPTLKVKRGVVSRRFEALIEKSYRLQRS